MKNKRILSAAAALSVALSASAYAPVCTALTADVSAASDQSEMFIYSVDDVELQYTVSGGEAIIHEIYCFSETEGFVIPSELNGCPVTTIAEDCTVGMNYLKGLVIPESVERLLSEQFIFYRGDEQRWVRIENADLYIPEVHYVFGQNITLLGKSGSTAEKYFNMNYNDDIRFKDYEAMVQCGPLGGVIYDGKITITSCSKDVTEVVIPEEIDGLPVTAIGVYAFADCFSMTSVYIPDTVTEIGDIAFSYCKSLTDVRLPEGLKKLPSGCFQQCRSLMEISLPDSITVIESAFYNCPLLEKVDFPDNVTSVGSGAFDDTPFRENNIGEDGLFIVKGCLIDDGKSYDKEELVIPEGIRCIAAGAFRDNTSIRSVTVPDSVVNIGESAFKGCTALTSVTLPDTLTEISSDMFSGCTSLTDVNIPSGLKKIGQSAFSGCEKLDGISLPDTLTDMGYRAFENCASLTEIAIPSGMTSMENCFMGCTALKKAVLSDGIKKVGFGAFSGCTSLEELVLPADLEVVERGAFSGCTSLTQVVFPDSIQSIRGDCFAKCTSLAEVTIPEKNGIDFCIGAFRETPWYDTISEGKDLIIINDMVADGTKCTGDVVIPDGIAAIGAEAFKGSEITSITLPDSVQRFGSQCFSDCKNLTEFTIPDGVTEIAQNMFSGCSALKKVDIPDSVVKIESGAFSFCNGFTEFAVPKNVETVEMAFEFCNYLKKITFENPDCFLVYDSPNFLLMPMATTVCGYAKSTAYYYAYSTKRDFEYITLPGDANNDGEVNMADAVMIMQSISDPEKHRLTDQGRKNADVIGGGDGVTNYDALAVQQYEAGLLDELNVG